MPNYNINNNSLSVPIKGQNVLNLSSSGTTTISGALIVQDFSGSGDLLSKITYINNTGSYNHPSLNIPYTLDLINIVLTNSGSNVKPVVITNGQYQFYDGTKFYRGGYTFGFANTGFQHAFGAGSMIDTGKFSSLFQYGVDRNFSNTFDFFSCTVYNLTFYGAFSSIINPRSISGYVGDGSVLGGFTWSNASRVISFMSGPPVGINNVMHVGTSQNTRNVNMVVSGNVYYTGSVSVGVSQEAISNSKIQISGNLIPLNNNNVDMNLGASDLVWNNAYAQTNVNLSDADYKTQISNSKLGLNFINQINPVKYKYKNSIRTHYGLVAQEIKQILENNGIDTKDFAGYVEGSEGNKFLRYEQFISPLIKAIQELSARIQLLEQEIKARGI
jgi:hypothetical protein